ncbi:class II fructose-bisphosphate aldolase [Arachnia propionica]|jgi:ketose-bisphosphate aldolase
MRTSTKSIVHAAQDGGYAVGAFNIFDGLTLRAVVHAAGEKRSPAIVQVSARTAKALGPRFLARMFEELAAGSDVPLSLHLDHCPDLELTRAVIDAGWSSVLFDASHLELAEAAEQTARVVSWAHPNGVDVESEIENIVGVEDGVGSDALAHSYADEELVRVARETGVDLLAPHLGTAHGQYKLPPVLLPQRVSHLRRLTDLPIVLHGGTGLKPEEFRSFISAGVSKINVSTAVKHAYLDAMEESLGSAREAGRREPLPILGEVERRVADTVASFLELFGSAGRAGGER